MAENYNNYIAINNRRIGPGYPVYIVAEMSANHKQDFDLAVKIIEAAKEAGADAIKLQTFTPETHTIDSNKEYFRVPSGTLWDNRTLFDLYREVYMPWEWQPMLKDIAEKLDLDFFSAAVDQTSVAFLEDMDVPVHKVTSFEIVDLALIEQMAKTGKPLIISTGMCTLAEIDEAVRTARIAGARQIALLKCNSAYPAPPEEMNLKTIPHLSDAFQVPVGISDHTLGIAIPITAVALGASIVEKHFTLSRSIMCADSAFSIEPHEFKTMVQSIRTAEKAVGAVCYGVNRQESKSLTFRRSLFVVRNVKAGENFTTENIRSIRPGHGLHPRYLKEILGRRASLDIEYGTPLDWKYVEGST